VGKIAWLVGLQDVIANRRSGIKVISSFFCFHGVIVVLIVDNGYAQFRVFTRLSMSGQNLIRTILSNIYPVLLGVQIIHQPLIFLTRLPYKKPRFGVAFFEKMC
jgi:hypothetical protein